MEAATETNPYDAPTVAAPRATVDAHAKAPVVVRIEPYPVKNPYENRPVEGTTESTAP